jgi:hypothetical protein
MRAITIAMVLSCVSAVHAQERIFQSGPQRTYLIELFTSQGCGSCPPAEAWFSKLKSQPGLWRDFVPLAFHVDYWDRLGWRDPFASREWTARQYQYSAKWNAKSVYTPGFVLDGREWFDRSVPSESKDKTSGILKITLADGKAMGEFKPTTGPGKDVDVYLAELGFDLLSKVTAGENNGRDLRQDFVVLSLTHQRMSQGKADIPFRRDSRAGAIAAWITPPSNIEPIQAVGGWLR